MHYDVVIIGGGSGGLVVASSIAQMGLKVLLIEKEKLGGDCLWTGCVPSKALIASAKRVHAIKTSQEMGLPKVDIKSIDIKKVMDRVRDVQKKIEPHDSPERFRKLGCDVEFGDAKFVDKKTIMLKNKKITFKYAVISTGSSPVIPNIPGLKDANHKTNIDIFQLDKLPKELAILGGGPIGVELGQAFYRLGSKVTIYARSGILTKDDPELAGMLASSLKREGVEIKTGYDIVSVQNAEKTIVIFKDQNGKEMKASHDGLLFVALGRKPNVEGLELEQGQVEYTKKGIVTDKYLRTTNKNVFAIGDVIGELQFTHVAGSHAVTAVKNMISPIKASKETIVPWVTYTDPELAHVGVISTDDAHEILEFSFKDNDRALTDGVATGKIKVLIDKDAKILGASILGPHAGELIMEYVHGMKHGLKLTQLASAIHPYPTLSGSLGNVVSAHYKKQLTPKAKKILQFLFRI